MKIFLAILSSVFLSSCNTPCNTPTSVASLITGAIVSAGGCSLEGAQAVSADVSKAVASLNLCTPARVAGPLSSVVCTPALNALGSLAGAALDAKYPGCNFSKVVMAPEAALVALCNQLPF